MGLQQRKEDATKNYAALGQFVAGFEDMVDRVREICIGQVSGDTKNSEARHLVRMSFHHQAMTARPLFDIMRAIFAELMRNPGSDQYASRGTFKKVLGCIEAEYSHLCYKRNELLHGTWLIGSPFFSKDCKTFEEGTILVASIQASRLVG